MFNPEYPRYIGYMLCHTQLRPSVISRLQQKVQGEEKQGKRKWAITQGTQQYTDQTFLFHRLETNTSISLWGNQVSEEMYCE